MLLLFSLLAAASIAFAVPAEAFHDGGVASCKGCHVMHESEEGQLVPVGDSLLRADSPSEVCLNCHATSNGAVFGNGPLMPGPEYGGGDFVFLLEDELYDGDRGPAWSTPGEAAGHSIVAPGRGLFADSRWPVAPGGSFPTADLGCTSCHDPHGNENFRMLHGAGPVQGDSYSFFAPAPAAVGVDLRGAPESDSNHTAYQSGWAQWCGNCHSASYHDDDGSRFDHPGEASLGSTVADRYNLYRGDQDPAGGSAVDSYLALVPFEDPASTTNGISGPAPTSRLSCISCHRVHASSGPAAGRWDFQVEFLAADGVASGSYPIADPWLDPAQRSACLKCHSVDHDNGKACVQCHSPGGGGKPPVLPTSN